MHALPLNLPLLERPPSYLPQSTSFVIRNQQETFARLQQQHLLHQQQIDQLRNRYSPQAEEAHPVLLNSDPCSFRPPMPLPRHPISYQNSPQREFLLQQNLDSRPLISFLPTQETQPIDFPDKRGPYSPEYLAQQTSPLISNGLTQHIQQQQPQSYIYPNSPQNQMIYRQVENIMPQEITSYRQEPQFQMRDQFERLPSFAMDQEGSQRQQQLQLAYKERDREEFISADNQNQKNNLPYFGNSPQESHIRRNSQNQYQNNLQQQQNEMFQLSSSSNNRDTNKRLFSLSYPEKNLIPSNQETIKKKTQPSSIGSNFKEYQQDNSQINQYAQEHNEMKKRIEDLEAERQKLLNDQKLQAIEIDTLKSTITSLQDSKKKLEDRINDLEDAAQKAQVEQQLINEICEKKDVEIEEHNLKLADKQRELLQAQADVEQMKIDQTDILERLTLYEETQEELQNQIAKNTQLTERNSYLNQEIQVQSEIVKQFEVQMKQLQAQLPPVPFKQVQQEIQQMQEYTTSLEQKLLLLTRQKDEEVEHWRGIAEVDSVKLMMEQEGKIKFLAQENDRLNSIIVGRCVDMRQNW